MAVPAAISWIPAQPRNVALEESAISLGHDEDVEKEHSGIEVIRFMIKPKQPIMVNTYDNPALLCPKDCKIRLPSFLVRNDGVIKRAKMGGIYMRVGVLRKNESKDIDPVTINSKLYCESRLLYLDDDTDEPAGLLVVHPDEEVVFLGRLNMDRFATELQTEKDAKPVKPIDVLKDKPKKSASAEPSKPKGINLSRAWGTSKRCMYWIQVIEASDQSDADNQPFYSPSVLFFAGLSHGRKPSPPSPATKKRLTDASSSSSSDKNHGMDDLIDEVENSIKKQKKEPEPLIVSAASEGAPCSPCYNPSKDS